MTSKAVYFPAVEEQLPLLTGKTVVITGTTTGTGLVTIKTLIKKEANIIALNRNTEKARKALIKPATNADEAAEKAAENEEEENEEVENLKHVECDLQSFESVKKAAEEVRELVGDDGIYCLANNAGIMMLKDTATKDGYDVQMQVNHLSHFLLTKLLLPELEKHASLHGEARVVNHSSVARNYASGKLKEKYFKKNGGKLGGNVVNAKFNRYVQTKLANAVFTMALKDKLEEQYGGKSGIKSVVCHPGIAKSELAQNMGFNFNNLGTYLFKVFVMGMNEQPIEDGALGLVKAIFLPEVESGDFWGPGPGGSSGDAKRFEPEKFCDSKENKELLWKTSEEAIAAYVV